MPNYTKGAAQISGNQHYMQHYQQRLNLRKIKMQIIPSENLTTVSRKS